MIKKRSVQDRLTLAELAAAAIDRQQMRLAIEAAEQSGARYPRRWLSRWGALRPSTSTALNQEYHRNRTAIAALVPKIQVERERPAF